MSPRECAKLQIQKISAQQGRMMPPEGPMVYDFIPSAWHSSGREWRPVQSGTEVEDSLVSLRRMPFSSTTSLGLRDSVIRRGLTKKGPYEVEHSKIYRRKMNKKGNRPAIALRTKVKRSYKRSFLETLNDQVR